MSDNRLADNTSESTALQINDEGQGNLSRLLLLGLAIGIGVVIVKQYPDMKRYVKMKAM